MINWKIIIIFYIIFYLIIFNYNSYLIDDINERWAYFLQKNVTYCTIDNFNEIKIAEEFNKFIDEIKEILSRQNGYEKFNNPFLRCKKV